MSDLFGEMYRTLLEDEGYKEEIYLDHLGFPTFGIGHKVTKNDPEYGQPVGTPVSEQRVVEAFREDLTRTVEGVERIYSALWELPEECQVVLCCMAFQMGVMGLAKFKKMWKAINKDDYATAAKEMLDSKWAKQTPVRAKRMANRMRNAA